MHAWQGRREGARVMGRHHPMMWTRGARSSSQTPASISISRSPLVCMCNVHVCLLALRTLSLCIRSARRNADSRGETHCHAVLRPERRADLILCLDARSLAGPDDGDESVDALRPAARFAGASLLCFMIACSGVDA